jgi:alpha-galactosidase/6-phospho-beta-glucosidase family protein
MGVKYSGVGDWLINDRLFSIYDDILSDIISTSPEAKVIHRAWPEATTTQIYSFIKWIFRVREVREIRN